MTLSLVVARQHALQAGQLNLRGHHVRNWQLATGNCQLGYTLIEMLTTVAALIIVLGLMISLAGHVRREAKHDLTREVLVKLDALMAQYSRQSAGQLPPVHPLVAPPAPTTSSTTSTTTSTTTDPTLDEASLQRSAPRNNAEFVRILRRQQNLTAGVFSDLPDSIYNEAALYDAWGTPIAFLPQGLRAIGTAPQDRFFFFSAGPDRKFLTREDNLYSYETTGRQTSNE